METTNRPTELFFISTKKGLRAYRWSRMQFRSFPIGLDEAKALIATGQGVDLGGHPFPKAAIR